MINSGNYLFVWRNVGLLIDWSTNPAPVIFQVDVEILTGLSQGPATLKPSSYVSSSYFEE